MHLIVRCYRGHLNGDDVFRFLMELSADIDYSPQYNVLNDFRQCILNTSKDDLLGLINRIGREEKVYSTRRIALLTNSANQVTFSEYIIFLKQEDSINMLTCSTLQNALIHLGIDVEKKGYIEGIIHDLQKALK